tara:strand:- start:7971 stop:9572 length:1602 start_codon:yes stop_codon:yes gene_type:complete
MAFEINRTGLGVSQSYLDVTSNNIANASSFGFKKSRAQFVDVSKVENTYALQSNQTGSGSVMPEVQQVFKQGFSKQTDSVLDISMEGKGFFVTSPNEGGANRFYTRAGACRVNNQNQIVNAWGDYLLGYPVDDDGNVPVADGGALEIITVPTVSGDPEMTQNISYSLNLPFLDAQESKPLNDFDPTDSDTYNYATGSHFYDSLGGIHELKVYFVKPAISRPTQFNLDPFNGWIGTDAEDVDSSFDFFDPSGLPPPGLGTAPVGAPDSFQDHQLYVAFYEIDGQPVQVTDAGGGLVTPEWNFSYDAKQEVEVVPPAPDDPFIDTIDIKINDRITADDHPVIADTGTIWSGAPVCFSRGMIVSSIPSYPVKLQPIGQMETPVLAGVDDTQQITIDFTDSTMFASDFQIYDLDVDGNNVGIIKGVDIERNGMVHVAYDNDESLAIACIAVAKFNSEEGLLPFGDVRWQETAESGEAIFGIASADSFGNMNASALELSNVSLSKQMIELIVAQRNYQASAKALDTENTMQQTIIQMN